MSGNVIAGAIKSFGPAALLNVGFGVMEYNRSREDGYSRVGSAARAVAEGVMIPVVGLPTYLGVQAARGLPAAAVKSYEGLARQSRSMSQMSQNKPFQNGSFVNTPQAYTMRQAGMQLAQASKHNLQHAMLGNEAQYLHL